MKIATVFSLAVATTHAFHSTMPSVAGRHASQVASTPSFLQSSNTRSHGILSRLLDTKLLSTASTNTAPSSAGAGQTTTKPKPKKQKNRNWVRQQVNNDKNNPQPKEAKKVQGMPKQQKQKKSAVKGSKGNTAVKGGQQPKASNNNKKVSKNNKKQGSPKQNKDNNNQTSGGNQKKGNTNKKQNKKQHKNPQAKANKVKGSPQKNNGNKQQKNNGSNKQANKSPKARKNFPKGKKKSSPKTIMPDSTASIMTGLASALTLDLDEIRKQEKEEPTPAKAAAKPTNTNEKKGIPLTELSPGDLITGKVMRLLPFGALVQTPYDIAGEPYGCAMLHISRITDDSDDNSASRPKNITQILKIGQEVKNARVVNINRDKGTVGISLRRKTKRVALQTIQVGSEVEGKVVRYKPYGVFVDIGTKRDALLHISRMSLYKVNDITDYAKLGQIIKARVIKADLDGSNKSIAISLLSPENDRFVDRRDRDRQRDALCEQLVLGPPTAAADLQKAKQQLLDIDYEIRQELEAWRQNEPGGRTGEV